MYSTSSKNAKQQPFFLRLFCKRVSKLLHYLMRKCEQISGDSKIIEEMQSKIKNEIEEAKNQKEELHFFQENIITKEEHIDRLYSFIGYIGVNFRNENFEEVDRAFRRINL